MGCRKKFLKGRASKLLGLGARLREHQLELVALLQHQLRAGLGRDAHPVEPLGRRPGAVGLHRHLEAARVQRVHQRRVELQQRLAAGADDELALGRAVPRQVDRVRQRVGARERAAAGAVGAHEVGVAEAADGPLAVALVAAPQVAAREAAEHRGSPGVRALALERVEISFTSYMASRRRNLIEPGPLCTGARLSRCASTFQAQLASTGSFTPTLCVACARTRGQPGSGCHQSPRALATTRQPPLQSARYSQLRQGSGARST